ncbi:hypothetical protein SAMN05444007_10769 [Cribrihabitans marinus]|uniref:Uncharacterized protein n=1 Tax=Cribrihabitans marinus TaxID=1227549 RepID=A0A1H7BL16_9RHOB|nr:hypothetical protein [Cribrihabitans marinus]GGH34388.1 hypothetical protein GCM10010973_27050 [Cribrihabitans marinus]SEJ77604.1 hypothetical protein SAMN05444007_10769 [Cribrihabitans marinus]
MSNVPEIAGRLRFHVAILAGTSIAGALVILAFTMGFYNWIAIAISVAAGIILAWPVGVWLTRRIKQDDPAWDADRDKAKPQVR